MSTIWIPNVKAGRQLRIFHHRVQAPVDGKLIHSPDGQVILFGSTNHVSVGPSTTSFGTVITLIPGVAGTERALILYIGASNRTLPLVFEITIVRSGGNDVFLAECVGDENTTTFGKGDYYLPLYFTHSTTSISFRQSEGSATLGNSYSYKAVYGPAEFRQRRLAV